MKMYTVDLETSQFYRLQDGQHLVMITLSKVVLIYLIYYCVIYKTINSVTFYGQDLYVLMDDGGLAVLKKIDSETPRVRVLAKAPASCCASLPQCFHLQCDRHILRVIVGKFGESVEVFKLTFSKTWEKVVGLGKNMIFICGASYVCLDAKTPQMENKIYFPSSPIMYYSVETCRFHTLNNEDSFGDFFGTKHHLNPHGWIEPRSIRAD
ncbi:hypothetical protein CTI12_AA399370 [Artemisia annua]|uniref:KIB1-4 beta-propeller domain-containing protein n=1 Tax=Artemisia annua TaxID=35608 RepID=A0A2U1MAG8_ARTAN|nr:hypothetical protein CTI12_AA399370 [Artemisia annua]